MSMDQPLGTAAWALPGEVAQSYAYEEGGFWLGRNPSDDATPLGGQDDRHVFLLGGSRAGKGTSFILPNLLLWPGSLVVVDPVGENATIAAKRRGPGSEYAEGMGQSVHILDPFKVTHGVDDLHSRFNPLDALDPDDEDTPDQAGELADAIVEVREGSERTWDTHARMVVKGLILHVLTAKEFAGRRNLVTVHALIMRGEIEAHETFAAMDEEQRIALTGEKEVPSAEQLLWSSLSGNPAFDGIVAGIGDKYGGMLKRAPKQYEGVQGALLEHTQWIESAGMKRCLETSDFKLSDLKTDPTGVSLFLTLPTRRKGTHSKWLRMMMTLCIGMMEAVRERPATGHRVLFCFDEFASLGRMEVIENATAEVAKYGAKLLIVVQAISQLKKTYKQTWNLFPGMSGVLIYCGVGEHESAEHASVEIGDTEVIRTAPTKSHAKGATKTRTKTTGGSRAHSHTEQSGYQESRGRSTSQQRSWSDTHGDSWGRSSGGFWSVNGNLNSNGGASWQPGLFFRSDERHSDGSGVGGGLGFGRNSGSNTGGNRSRTQGGGEGETEQHNSARTWNTSDGVTNTETWSKANAEGTTETDTEGLSGSVHKRRLINPDEVGRFAKRIDDKNHDAYPGLALVRIEGEAPFFVRRTNYYDDPAFIGLFDPHPDHDYRPLIEQSETILGPDYLKNLYEGTELFRVTQWFIEPGQRVALGAPIAEVAGQVNGKERSAMVRSPVDGWVEDVTGRDDPEIGGAQQFEDGTWALPHIFAEISYFEQGREPEQADHLLATAELRQLDAEIEEEIKEQTAEDAARAAAAEKADKDFKTEKFREAHEHFETAKEEYNSKKWELIVTVIVAIGCCIAALKVDLHWFFKGVLWVVAAWFGVCFFPMFDEFIYARDSKDRAETEKRRWLRLKGQGLREARLSDPSWSWR